MPTEIKGTLEIDRMRGVIYFHSDEGKTMLRIYRLPRPIVAPADDPMLDITHMRGCNWREAQ